MFCKHCGKNIYDLEKCPFCANGEKIAESNSEKELESCQNKDTPIKEDAPPEKKIIYKPSSITVSAVKPSLNKSRSIFIFSFHTNNPI